VSEIADTFNALREIGKQRRADNRSSSADLLTERGIRFESKNGGAHLVVQHAGKVADLWPGTGKYRVRQPGGKGEVYRRGVFNLLRDLGAKP
jgi:hypothetical protein